MTYSSETCIIVAHLHNKRFAAAAQISIDTQILVSLILKFVAWAQ